MTSAKKQSTKKQTEIKNNKVIGVKTPFSDKDLDYFKNLILEKRKEAIEEIDRLRNRILNDNHRDLDNDSEYSYHLADSASVSSDREHVYRMIDRQERFVGYLDRALERINNKSYGICRVTGKAINKERLEAIPHTELSIEGKLQEKKLGMAPAASEDMDLIAL
jgi:RNA polymerase-binding protein DksA